MTEFERGLKTLGCQRGCQTTKTAAPEWNGRSEIELDFEVSPLGLEPRTG